MIEKLYQRALRPKPVHYLNGRRQRRPGKNHPNPEHWAETNLSRGSRRGVVGCGVVGLGVVGHGIHGEAWSGVNG